MFLLYIPFTVLLFNLTKCHNKSYDKKIVIICIYVIYEVRMKELVYLPHGHYRGRRRMVQCLLIRIEYIHKYAPLNRETKNELVFFYMYAYVKDANFNNV